MTQEAQQEVQAEIQVAFTITEINQILERLGELPAKNVFDLIGFVRQRAQEVVNATQAPAEQG